jgi:hypothetical protein
MPTIAITDAIKTLAEAERRFGLVRSEDDSFFPEWQVGLAELSIAEKSNLDDLRRRYLYQRSEGAIVSRSAD